MSRGIKIVVLVWCRHKGRSFSLVPGSINTRKKPNHDSAVGAARRRRSAGCFNRSWVQFVRAEEESNEGEKRGPKQSC